MNLADLIKKEYIDAKPEASEFVDTILKNADAENAPEESAAVGGGNGQATIAPIDDGASGTFADSVSDGLRTENSTGDFDAAIHCTDEFGAPRLNKDGSFRKRPGRRSIQPVIASQVSVSQLKCKQAAIMTVQTIIVLGHTIGGDEWDAKNDEVEAMNEAWRIYYIERGIEDFPAWLGVAIATGAYVLPRTQKPKTRERLAAIGGSLKRGVFRFATFIGIVKRRY